jgi:hypothetical protein
MEAGPAEVEGSGEVGRLGTRHAKSWIICTVGASRGAGLASIEQYDNGARSRSPIPSSYFNLRRIRQPAVGLTAESPGHECAVREMFRN